MRPFAVTLQVVSSLLIVLGLGTEGCFVVMLTMPHFDMHGDPASLLVSWTFLLLPIGAIATFAPFHDLRWPATLVSMLGFLEAAGALYAMLLGFGEASQHSNGPFSGLGGAILIYLSVAAILGAGMLILGGTLSLASGQTVGRQDDVEW